MNNSYGILAQRGDYLEVASLAGVRFTLTTAYETGEVAGFTAVKVQFLGGTPDAPDEANLIKTWDQTDQPWGKVALDTGADTATITITDTANVPTGAYAFRWLCFVGSVCVERTVYGLWRHRPAR